MINIQFTAKIDQPATVPSPATIRWTPRCDLVGQCTGTSPERDVCVPQWPDVAFCGAWDGIFPSRTLAQDRSAPVTPDHANHQSIIFTLMLTELSSGRRGFNFFRVLG